MKKHFLISVLIFWLALILGTLLYNYPFQIEIETFYRDRSDWYLLIGIYILLLTHVTQKYILKNKF